MNGNSEDSFDNLDSLRAPLTSVSAGQPTKPRRNRVRDRHPGFTQVPSLWKERLKGAGGAVHDLALELLHERWRSDKETGLVVSNALAARAGVSRQTKPRALAKLERLGLVEVVRQGRQAPRVTMFHWKC